MDDPCLDYVWRLVESARSKSLLVRRRLNLLVSCEPSFVIFRKMNDSTCILVDCLHQLWPSPLRVVLPSPFEVSIKCARDLSMYSQSAPPSTSVSDGECFPLVFDELVGDPPVQALSVAKDVVFPGDMGVHSLGDGSRVRISLAADDPMVSWHEQLVYARGLFSCSGRGSEARGHQSVSVEDRLQPSAEDPEMSKGQGDRDGQEDELVVRLLAPLCSSGGRRLRRLVRILKQSPDTAGGVHSGRGCIRRG